MPVTSIDIETTDGVVDTHFLQPDSDGPHPAVIFYMDAIGDRHALFDMADRLTATDKPDSPHLLAPKMRGEICVGVPEIDPHLAPDETARLEAALKDAGVKYTIEIYPGAKHGFAVPGQPVYDTASSERHWNRLLALLKTNLLAN